MLRRCFVSPSSSTAGSLSKNAALAGGFNADGLREWAMLTNFGADSYDSLTGQELRRRRRMIPEDPKKQPYVDLFSKRVSDESSDYLMSHSSPSDALGRAFFGSKSFMGEKLVLSSLNTLFSFYPVGTTTIPTHFKLNGQYLLWTVTAKSPLELICSYKLAGLNIKGCTMLAFDPSLRKAYHGNVIDVTEEVTRGFLTEIGIRMHVNYAEFLLAGMANELENMANEIK